MKMSCVVGVDVSLRSDLLSLRRSGESSVAKIGMNGLIRLMMAWRNSKITVSKKGRYPMQGRSVKRSTSFREVFCLSIQI